MQTLPALRAGTHLVSHYYARQCSLQSAGQDRPMRARMWRSIIPCSACGRQTKSPASSEVPHKKRLYHSMGLLSFPLVPLVRWRPKRNLSDAGPSFTPPYCENACKSPNITLRHTIVENHNSLVEGETNLNGQVKVFMKLQNEHPAAPRAHLHHLAVFAMNTSTNLRDLVPLLLVYGMFPRLPHITGSGRCRKTSA